MMSRGQTHLMCVYTIVNYGPANPAGIEREANVPVHRTRDS